MSVRLSLLWTSLLVGCVGGLKCWDCPSGKSCPPDHPKEMPCDATEKHCQITYVNGKPWFRGCALSCEDGDLKSCDQAKSCCCNTDLCNCNKEDIAKKICKLPSPTTPPTTTPAPPTKPPPRLKCWNKFRNEEVVCAADVKWCHTAYYSNHSDLISGCAFYPRLECTENKDKCIKMSDVPLFMECCCDGDLCNKEKKCQPKDCFGRGTTTGPPGGGPRPDTKTTATALAHLFAFAVLLTNHDSSVLFRLLICELQQINI